MCDWLIFSQLFSQSTTYCHFFSMPLLSDSPKGKPGFLKKILKRSSGVLESNNRPDSSRSSISTKVDSKDSTNTLLKSSGSLGRTSSQKYKSKPSNTYFDEEASTFEEDGTGDDDDIDDSSLRSSIASHDLDNFDHLMVNEKVQFPTVSNVQYDYSETDFNPPWVDLTYESLIFPTYIKTSRKNRWSPKLNHLFLAQELIHDSSTTSNAQKTVLDYEFDDKLSEVQSIFLDDNNNSNSNNSTNFSSNNLETNNSSEILVMEFNKDGMYMASAGRDGTIKIWKVISSPLARLQSTSNSNSDYNQKKSKKSKKKKYTSAPVFHTTPTRIFKGHNGNIISLDWSKNNFLITGSMDRTAKLWHVDRDECLHTFKMEDFVTAVKFHPTDDRFFVSGSLDNRVLLWSVLENSIAFERSLGDEVLITALTFTPDGKNIVVGGFNGSIFMLETKGLHIIDRIEVKNNSLSNKIFHNKNDNKITGIVCFEGVNDEIPKNVATRNWSFLVTTNDSKIRLGSSSSRKVVTRFKGLTNASSSIVASTDFHHKYIISGSEDHRCYIWENNNEIVNKKISQSVKELVQDGKQHLAEAQKHKKLGKLLLADNKYLKKMLDNDDDIIDFKASENNSYTSFHSNHSRVSVAIFAPENTMSLLEISDDIIYDLVKRGTACSFENGQMNNLAGQIIVTADENGTIRVFREDSAYYYRQQFLQLYKRGKQKCGGHENNNLSNATVTGDSEGLDSSLNYRGLSPRGSAVDTFPLKLHNRLRGNSNASQNQENFGPTSLNSMGQSGSPNCKLSTISRSSIFGGGGGSSNFGKVRSKTPPLRKYGSAEQSLNISAPTSNVQSIENRFSIPKPAILTPGRTSSSIPLLVNTDFDEDRNDEVIDFKTPITSLHPRNFNE